MSTESIETVTHFHRNGVAFLPMARGVFYEFLKEDETQTPDNLQSGSLLQKAEKYRMLVTHKYGAQRYQTGDVFLVKQFIGGLPDLRFLRRWGLAYSFTGEKLTGEQLAEVYRMLQDEHSTMDESGFLTCFPSQPETDSIPHYKISFVRRDGPSGCALSGIAERCDQLLSELNTEYRDKRNSGRLGPMQFQQMDLSEFRKRMTDSASVDFDAQFKFLPLYPYLWESLDRPK